MNPDTRTQHHRTTKLDSLMLCSEPPQPSEVEEETTKSTSATGKCQDSIEWPLPFYLRCAANSRTQVGACIVDSKICLIAIGYNGFPRNCSDDEFSWRQRIYTNAELDSKHLYVVHAEANAILNKNIMDL